MPGSDLKINYNIRQSKSIERKMMCDLIREIQIITGIRDFRYIGMGAKYFSDFILFHHEFGINDMISIEADCECKIRYEFNKPLKNIEIKYGHTTNILPSIGDYDKKIHVVWLDYDESFKEYMINDIKFLVSNLIVGSIFFISCNYSFAGQKQSEKRESFKKSVGSFFDKSIPKSMYTNNNIPILICNIINREIREKLRLRNLGGTISNVEYMQLLFMTYKDGAPMLTIGGILVDNELKEKIYLANLQSKLSFIRTDANIPPFNIEIPKLTYKEIQNILRLIPITDEEYNANIDSFYGVKLEDVRSFESIYRYYPYFTESKFSS